MIDTKLFWGTRICFWMFSWANNVTFTTTSLNWASGIWVLLIVFNARIWIPCIFLPFLRISIIQENSGNWNHLIFSSSENLSSILWLVSFIRMRKVFSWYLPLNHGQEHREDCKPSCCWQRSITSEPGPVSCSAITPPFQNSAKLPTSRDLFPSPLGYFMTVLIKQLRGSWFM